MNCISNVHTHCTWCDGSSTPREVVEQAIAYGFSDLGFSSHSPAPFDPSCPGIRDEAAYRADINALKQEYAGRLGILCGVEQEFYGPVDTTNYDYFIGSCHYFPLGENEKVSADFSEEISLRVKDEYYGGDGIAMARDFYALSAENVRRFKPTIVGHYDVLGKFNKTGSLFDEQSKAYRQAALEPMDAIIDIIGPYGGMIELNTAALVRGLRDVPYPAPFLLRHMAQRGARVIITTDSHRADTLNAGFEQGCEFLRQAGYSKMAVLKNGEFVDVGLG